MNIRLTLRDACYLLENLALDDCLRRSIYNLKVDFGAALTRDQIDELRNLCGELLQLRGFDESYQPTEEGVLLEDLVDRFYVG